MMIDAWPSSVWTLPAPFAKTKFCADGQHHTEKARRGAADAKAYDLRNIRADLKA